MVPVDRGSSSVNSAVVDALQRGQWCPGDLFGCLHHSLQAFMVHGCCAAVPCSNKVGLRPACQKFQEPVTEGGMQTKCE